MDHVLDHLLDRLFQVTPLDHFAAAAIKILPLEVHHLIVFQQALTCFKVALFNFFLCLLDSLADASVLNRHPFFPTDKRQQFDGHIRRENTHQVIIKRQKEYTRAIVSLPTRTTTELIVDPAGFMPFSTENMQTAQFNHAITQLDIGTPAGHIRGYRYITLHRTVPCSMLMAGLFHDHRFAGVLFGVQHFMLNTIGAGQRL